MPNDVLKSIKIEHFAILVTSLSALYFCADRPGTDYYTLAIKELELLDRVRSSKWALERFQTEVGSNYIQLPKNARIAEKGRFAITISEIDPPVEGTVGEYLRFFSSKAANAARVPDVTADALLEKADENGISGQLIIESMRIADDSFYKTQQFHPDDFGETDILVTCRATDSPGRHKLIVPGRVRNIPSLSWGDWFAEELRKLEPDGRYRTLTGIKACQSKIEALSLDEARRELENLRKAAGRDLEVLWVRVSGHLWPKIAVIAIIALQWVFAFSTAEATKLIKTSPRPEASWIGTYHSGWAGTVAALSYTLLPISSAAWLSIVTFEVQVEWHKKLVISIVIAASSSAAVMAAWNIARLRDLIAGCKI